MPVVLLGLLTAVPHIVAGVEILFKHGRGADKKQAAMDMLGDLVNVFQRSNTGADSSTMQFIDDVIEAVVKKFNSDGTFTHATK